MKNKLLGWKLIEGSIGMLKTKNPSISEVVAALEAINPIMENPFMILEAPSVDRDAECFCQAYADEYGYVCEIRIFAGEGFTHSRAFLPDAEGDIGSNEGPFPNLTQAIRIFTGFIANHSATPAVDAVQWLDVSYEFKPVAA